MGAATRRMAALLPSTHQMWSKTASPGAQGGAAVDQQPCMAPRDAAARCETGLFSTTARSHSHFRLSRPTKMSLANVRGMRKTKLVVMTDSGVFTFMPMMIQNQESAKAKVST